MRTMKQAYIPWILKILDIVCKNLKKVLIKVEPLQEIMSL